MRITATEASRGFSELLSRVAAGETVEIERHGQVVAIVDPPRPRAVSAERFLEIMRNLPPVDPDFAGDVERLDEALEPYEDPWPS